jgi:hypothetical protein
MDAIAGLDRSCSLCSSAARCCLGPRAIAQDRGSPAATKGNIRLVSQKQRVSPPQVCQFASPAPSAPLFLSPLFFPARSDSSLPSPLHQQPRPHPLLAFVPEILLWHSCPSQLAVLLLEEWIDRRSGRSVVQQNCEVDHRFCAAGLIRTTTTQETRPLLPLGLDQQCFLSHSLTGPSSHWVEQSRTIWQDANIDIIFSLPLSSPTAPFHSPRLINQRDSQFRIVADPPFRNYHHFLPTACPRVRTSVEAKELWKISISSTRHLPPLLRIPKAVRLDIRQRTSRLSS